MWPRTSRKHVETASSGWTPRNIPPFRGSTVGPTAADDSGKAWMSGAAHNVSEGLGEGLYKALFDHAVVGLTLTDGDRRILECNDAYCEIVGRPREDVIGRRARDFDPPEQPDIT